MKQLYSFTLGAENKLMFYFHKQPYTMTSKNLTNRLFALNKYTHIFYINSKNYKYFCLVYRLHVITPTLVIKKSDLDKHSAEFEKFWEWEHNIDEKRIMEYLKEVYEKYDVVKIDGIELIICSPEFSSLSELVRHKLYEWEVQFGISN